MEDLRSYASVARWVDGVNRYYKLSESEWVSRLAALRVFCERIGKDPDAVIRSAVEEKGAKVEMMRRSKQIAKEVEGDGRAAHDWDGIVRSFFIHNGARVVVRPYEDE
ncbi:MAG TPA: hypothetical protein VLF14_02130 [Candidatus Binatia bacterium]|nr:hypothetical protein [Candidatus Binatia bacterium]